MRRNMSIMKILNVKKIARTFMPEIIAPGTGLSTPTNKSVIPANNVPTIQDVLDGSRYSIPDAGGNWGKGEDIQGSYKEEGDLYKRRERDFEIMTRITRPLVDESEKWKVKVPGGAIEFPSFALVQEFREKMKQKGVPIKWVARVAQEVQDKDKILSSSLKSTFKLESIDTYNSIKETGAAFCVSTNIFVTCAHVVLKYDKKDQLSDVSDYKNRLKINIIQNGIKHFAELIAINGSLDIAILRSDLDVFPFDMDVGTMQIGDEILVIGSPHGFENNVSFGNIGSIDKQIYSHRGAPKYFFIDAPVFHGNSGGPIVNVNSGKAVGMLTSIVAKNGEYGLNVGLPSNYIRNFCIMNNIVTK
jgi:hypothetical protein